MPAIRAVLFDLDGTLNGIDMGDFLPLHFQALGRWVGDLIEPDRLLRELWVAAGAMMGGAGPAADPGLTNLEKFRRAFLPGHEELRDRLWARLQRFYREGVDGLERHAPRKPEAREVVLTVQHMGMRTAVATNPVFPEAFIRRRLEWAGLGDVAFDLVTTMENAHHCKPSAAYFLEVAEGLGVEAERCLMVGNDLEQDMAAARAGMATFWVTDGPAGRGRAGFQPQGQGPLGSLVPWLKDRLGR